MDRHYNQSITRGYAGHLQPRGENITGTYTKATLPEIATALAAYTREPHPLADTPPPDGGHSLFPAFTPVLP
ncbi:MULTISPECIES: hypothetical protein [Actinosynnema]|uniref:hypothetical protein n=1 Tax=Actinosynnema TaxID=40566 RepID=UPI0020A5B87E|nr:hypothetical protein [Actinosynnema pretiosum]MCP2099999.1 hypothetical protein [Actinosynnema pretiosum]